jgi:thioredoxin reductase
MTTTDVLIVGGGHAGLSAALTLYRAQHTSVIFDSGKPRNSYPTTVHLTPTWEHSSTNQVRETSRKELIEAGHTTFVDAEVVKVEQTADGFRIVDDKGTEWLGRKLLLASGMRDKFPDVAGYDKLYTRGIYPCMFQFGYELRGAETAGLLAVDALSNPMQAIALAHDGHKFADNMVIYTDGNADLAKAIGAQLTTKGITVDDRKIARLDQADKQRVVLHFEDGTQRTEAFLVHRPNTELDRRLVDQLSLAIGPVGEIAVTPPFCKTSLPGVYAAGDCATMMKTILNAMNMGAYAGCGLCRELPKKA